MSDRTGFQASRRSFLSLGTALAFAGCTALGSSSRTRWEEKDEFPKDESRNRKCNIRSLDPGVGQIGLMPFAYSIDGRADLHGTNQHVNVHLKSKSSLDVFISDQKNAALKFHKLHSAGKEVGDADGDIFRHIDEYAQRQVETYDQLMTIPDESTYTIIAAPADREPGTRGLAQQPIDVRYSFGCSFFLPFEEYKQLSDGEN